MTRADVYKMIDTERDYQNALGPDRTDCQGQGHTVGDYIVMLQHYQTELVAAWTKNPGNAKALDVIRKIAGIAVRCGEDHGLPPRVTK